ncbi:hypothetical protein COV82_06020 [Candidatus Peregrinibacteria bacterium CG11_big_fil_rev_8_21_14_0_20_46_8]|nr:MAG: hypothetical protein COV82_06020 [Candidatus Peregrinibacteria bacterium CG11_big_fil_rev_8_21_14_0_20_46_8]
MNKPSEIAKILLRAALGTAPLAANACTSEQQTTKAKIEDVITLRPEGVEITYNISQDVIDFLTKFDIYIVDDALEIHGLDTALDFDQNTKAVTATKRGEAVIVEIKNYSGPANILTITNDRIALDNEEITFGDEQKSFGAIRNGPVPKPVQDLLNKYGKKGWVYKSETNAANEFTLNASVKGRQPVWGFLDGKFYPVTYTDDERYESQEEFEKYLKAIPYRKEKPKYR